MQSVLLYILDTISFLHRSALIKDATINTATEFCSIAAVVCCGGGVPAGKIIKRWDIPSNSLLRFLIAK